MVAPGARARDREQAPPSARPARRSKRAARRSRRRQGLRALERGDLRAADRAAARDAASRASRHPRDDARRCCSATPSWTTRRGATSPRSRELIARCHESDGAQGAAPPQARGALPLAATAPASCAMERDATRRYLWVVVAEDLQRDFSLHQTLSLYLVEAIARARPRVARLRARGAQRWSRRSSRTRMPILRAQVRRAQGELIAQLKAEGVPYEERMERLEEVTHPKPQRGVHLRHLRRFRGEHPWVGERGHPPEVDRARDGRGLRRLRRLRAAATGSQRSEGLLLRYLSQLYKTLVQNVPERAQDRRGLRRRSLPARARSRAPTRACSRSGRACCTPSCGSSAEERRAELAREALWVDRSCSDDAGDFAARVRAELHLLVRALADATGRRRRSGSAGEDPADPGTPRASRRRWRRSSPSTARCLHARGAPPPLDVDPPQRRPLWGVSQTLLDPEEDDLWAVTGTIDLRRGKSLESPLFQLERIGT